MQLKKHEGLKCVSGTRGTLTYTSTTVLETLADAVAHRIDRKCRQLSQEEFDAGNGPTLRSSFAQHGSFCTNWQSRFDFSHLSLHA